MAARGARWRYVRQTLVNIEERPCRVECGSVLAFLVSGGSLDLRWLSNGYSLYADTKGTTVQLELPDDHVNELQRRSIIKLVDRLKHAKSVDIHCRINGEDKVLEADWLKHLKFSHEN